VTAEPQDRVTQILRAGAEDENAWSQLLPLIYDELHTIAKKRMSSERPDHTLQATALVNEAYMRLVTDQDMDWKSRRHFFGAAAEAMRRILIDHARKVRSQKRGGDRARVTLSVAGLVDDTDPNNILALDEALSTLEREDPRAAEVARLRYYTGLEVEETAKALEISPRTVMREWAYARARLFELMGGERKA
jgi:RNA polymerase sigma factor (TIGR02999 family)